MAGGLDEPVRPEPLEEHAAVVTVLLRGDRESARDLGLFDQHVRTLLPERTAQIAGFRYFNVYGRREQHKGRGSSVAWHFCQQYRAEGRVALASRGDRVAVSTSQFAR